MKLIKPSIQNVWKTPNALKVIEWSGRTCYKSLEKAKPGSAEKFVRMIIKSGHHSVLEHASASYRIICDRGVTHEIVRHRLASYSQESTRYCDYRDGVAFIIPPWIDITEGVYENWESLKPQVDTQINIPGTRYWLEHKLYCEQAYQRLRDMGWPPERARSELPNALKTEIVMTCNFREWRHFFKLRTHKKAHPQMREIANMILKDIRERVPVVFDEDML